MFKSISKTLLTGFITLLPHRLHRLPAVLACGIIGRSNGQRTTLDLTQCNILSSISFGISLLIQYDTNTQNMPTKLFVTL